MLGAKNLLAKVGPVAYRSKANKEARLVERKVCFILEASNPAVGRHRARAFIGEGRGLHAETAESALTVILKLIRRWSDQHRLVLSTVSLQLEA